jgi:hypothetical protein
MEIVPLARGVPLYDANAKYWQYKTGRREFQQNIADAQVPNPTIFNYAERFRATG